MLPFGHMCLGHAKQEVWLLAVHCEFTEAKHLVQGIVSCLLSYTGCATAGWSNAALTLRSAQHIYMYLGFQSLSTGM